MKRKRNTPFPLFIHQIKGSAGFSLIEILVASAIASIIMVMVYTAYHSIVKTIQDVNAYSEFYVNVNMALSTINRDIGNMYMNTGCRLLGDTDKGNSSVNFVTVNHREFNVLGGIKRAVPVSDINEVGYFLVPDDKFPDLFFLMRREDRGYDDDITAGGASNMMLENVLELKFEFRSGNDWTLRWDSIDTKRYPAAIRTTLTVKNYSGKNETFVLISSPDMGPVIQ